MKEQIGQKIKRLMTKSGLSQKQLALETDIDPGNLSKILNGKKIPSNDHLDRFSNALKLSLDKLKEDAKMELYQEELDNGVAVCINPACSGKEINASSISLNIKKIKKTEDGREEIKNIDIELPSFSSNTKYCGYCGSTLRNSCPFCNTIIKNSKHKHCIECGGQLFPECSEAHGGCSSTDLLIKINLLPWESYDDVIIFNNNDLIPFGSLFSAKGVFRKTPINFIKSAYYYYYISPNAPNTFPIPQKCISSGDNEKYNGQLLTDKTKIIEYFKSSNDDITELGWTLSDVPDKFPFKEEIVAIFAPSEWNNNIFFDQLDTIGVFTTNNKSEISLYTFIPYAAAVCRNCKFLWFFRH